MMSRRISIFVIFISAIFSFNISPVKYDIQISKDSLKAGETFSIIIDTEIDSNFLIYASDTLNLNPTQIEWMDSSYFSRIDIMTDSKAPKVKFDKYLQADVLYHTDQVSFYQEYQLADNIIDDTVLLEGEFIYQACDDKMCIPFWEPFSKQVNIIGTIDSEFSSKDDFDVDDKKVVLESSSKDDFDVDDKKEISLISKFFIAFIAGLIAIVTPCVFPMIPMTVAFFSKGNDKSRNEAIKSGLLFGLSIILMFITFGVIFSFVFKTADIMNEIATGAISNILFAIIFIIFAISFFGFFEIRLPNKFLNKINKKADGGGVLGTFFMALTLVLVSFSCTAPIVGTVIIDSISGDFWGPIIAMLGFSIAFAIPFSLFAIFPKWLENLPQSGGWLNSVKIVLGFLELALAIKFLSMPDQAYHWGILPRDVFLLIWILIFFCMGLYLFGIIKFAHDSGKIKFGVGRIVAIVINFIFCSYMIMGVYGSSIPLLEGIIPPKKVVSCGSGPGLCEDIKPKYSDILHLPHGLVGYFDYNQAIECAKKKRKPIFVDFTGHACFNCRKMEAVVWKDPRVLDILKNDYIIVALYVDDRTKLRKSDWYTDHKGRVRKTIGKKNFFIQYDKFKANAQPYYVILDPFEAGLEQNQEDIIKPLVAPRGYDTSVEGFIDFLNEGKNKFNNKYGENK